uniref:Uncharacterized protein n=1 Tax=uncultured Acidobacteriales bacterium HF0200_23L05 TaxID=710732 RepID=E0XUJ2_9BACT|nr:hypothetical protein [uncultured Acidobacteriales bacterium HF0200_23L05]
MIGSTMYYGKSKSKLRTLFRLRPWNIYLPLFAIMTHTSASGDQSSP